jgi:glycosyltransferase involved in cell wall biosynthesis
MASQLRGFGDVTYKVLKNYFGIAFGVIKELLKNYDLVVDSLGSIEALFSFTIAKLRRKPIIFGSEHWGWKGGAASPFARFVVPRSDAIFVPGSKHREYFISLGISPNKVFIVPNASDITSTDEDYEKKEQLKKKLNIGTRKVILYVGRLVKRKGVEYLIEAFAKLRKERDDVVLIIAGIGESKTELELLREGLGIKDDVYFVGHLGKLLPAYYALCDICVVPSITEGMGDPWVFVVNEAMHFGKPVIATDAVGAAYDMIKDGINGFMVPEKNAHALYQAIKKIISDPELEKRMGEESKRIIERGFTYDHMVEGFMKAIESIACKSRSM